MNNPIRVLQTQPLAPDLKEQFADRLELVSGIHAEIRLHLAEQGRGFAALLVGPSTPLPADTLRALAPDLRFISSFSAGVDNIDLEAAAELGIGISNSGSAVADPTADITLLLILATARDAGVGYSLVKRGEWQGMAKHKPSGIPLGGRTLGIVGLGNIGRAVAVRARAFGLNVIYHNRRPLDDAQAGGARYCATLESLLAESDIVSLHCPLTEQTRGLINAQTLNQMRNGSILINTSRGEVLDDAAVVSALDSGRLYAVGLDVYAGEPDLHPAYRTSERVFTLPHIGTATDESRRRMGEVALENLVLFFAGEPIPDLLLPPRESSAP